MYTTDVSYLLTRIKYNFFLINRPAEVGHSRGYGAWQFSTRKLKILPINPLFQTFKPYSLYKHNSYGKNVSESNEVKSKERQI